MDGQTAKGREKGTRLIALLSFFWALILVTVALLFLLPRLPEAAVKPQKTLVQSKAFPLRGASADALTVLGGTLVRVEEEGLVTLDAAGREQAFIPFPYRRSRVVFLDEGLLVTPEEGSGCLAVFPDLFTYELDAKERIDGGALRAPYLLTFGASLKGRLVASLVDTRTGAPRAAITFPSQVWPLRASFVPGEDRIDFLILDLSQGRLETRFLRYDFDGRLIDDWLLSDHDVFPLAAYPGDGRLFFFNDREAGLFDPAGSVPSWASLAGTPVHLARGGGRLALLTDREGQGGLFLVEAGGGDGEFLRRVETPDPVTSPALSPDGSLLLLASGDRLCLYGADPWILLAELPAGGEVSRLMALGDRHFLVIFDQEAAVVTVR